MPISDPQSFHSEALYQCVCAVCDAPGPFHAHHVVDKQTLRSAGVREADRYDTRNALRLCCAGNNCHFQFEHAGPGKVDIRLRDLPSQAIEYAEEVLGPGKAYNYLTRNYAGTDPRVDALLEAA